MKFIRGRLYKVRFHDHNEDSDEVNPNFTLNLVGRFKREKVGYLVFENWWPDTPGEGTRTVANVLKAAIIEARELKEA